MNRDRLLKYGLVGSFLLGAVGACSASGGKDNHAGFGGGTNFGGNNNLGGNVNFGGGVSPNGGDVSFNSGGNVAVGGGQGAGGLPPTDSDGHIGPAHASKCADAAKYQAGGGAALKILYPYDGTVFPRGLSGPLVMWEGAADQVYIEGTSASGKWSYNDCKPPTEEGVRFQIPDEFWQGAASWSDGTGDPLTIKVVTASGGNIVASASVTVKFALTTLKGAIYYNTYGSALAANNGAVIKLLPGAPAPTLFLTDTGAAPIGPCRSCHALSANGTAMTANHHNYVPGLAQFLSESYDVTGPTPTLVKDNLPEAGFAAIYPDGSRLMTNGPPNDSISPLFPTAPGDVTALMKSTSKMLDFKTAAEIPTQGWNAVHAQMPMFSPDGKHIVYNDGDQGPTTDWKWDDNVVHTVHGHSLWVADFDAATNTFSNTRELYTDPDHFLAWPFFTADSAQVVFAVDNRPDFTSQVPSVIGITAGISQTSAVCNAANPKPQNCTGRGHLMIADVATKKVAALDLANGYKGGQSYLPGGKDRDNELEFFPTVSPISGGGYSWVLFTSRRTYGNKLVKDLEDATMKKIWVTAVALGGAPGTDTSNPPFLLPGQELESGNVRAFAALEPCKEDGQACSSGSECCKGHCTNIDPKTGIGVCGQLMIHECSRVDDRCETDEDCCTGPDNGVNGRPLRCIKTAGSAYCGQGGIK